MWTFLLIFFLFIIISMLIMFLNFSISIKSLKTREKTSPFECGFDPLSNSRIPFSIQFFIISLIFLIFDVEITMIIPLIYMFFLMKKSMIFSSFLFLFILIFGLMIEYLEQSLDWKI